MFVGYRFDRTMVGYRKVIRTIVIDEFSFSSCSSYGDRGPANFVLLKLDENHFPDENNVQIDTIEGHGPHSARQDRSHCHQVQFDANHLYGIDLGTDTINVYQYMDGLKLSRSRISTAPGAGPRHLLFHHHHHQDDFAYVVNELDSTTNVYRFGSNVELLQSITTRDSTTQNNENAPAELQLTSDGKYLLVSNRGDDNIVVYSIDQGLLKIKESLNIRGSAPRYFTFDPTGQFLLVANQNSNDLICFRYDSNEGSFQFVSHLNNLVIPQHILFF